MRFLNFLCKRFFQNFLKYFLILYIKLDFENFELFFDKKEKGDTFASPIYLLFIYYSVIKRGYVNEPTYGFAGLPSTSLP